MTAPAYAPRGTASTTRVPLTVYGRRWCGISQMIRRYLDRLGVPYEYVDMDQNPAVERQLSWLTGGRVRSPTIRLGDQLLVQPSTHELSRALARQGVIR
jgi:mycoredoxin